MCTVISISIQIIIEDDDDNFSVSVEEIVPCEKEISISTNDQ